MFSPFRRLLVPFLALPCAALAQDAPPINAAEILATLRQLREAQTAQEKSAKQTAIQQAAQGAASGERALALWVEAVRVTQFQGAAQENAAFREWKDREGEGLKSREGQAAAQLFFKWLGLTLQRSSGVEVKDLLPQLIAYTKEATALDVAADALDETIRKERDAAAGMPRRSNVREKVADSQSVKRAIDQMFKRPLSASPVVEWMKLGEYVRPEQWEASPGNIDGIFQKIVLPELRAQKDPRALEYWDIRLKREAEAATARRVDFEIAKFNSVRRPELLWSRAVEMGMIGQKNRAATEMLALIKANPTHPDTAKWIGELEKLLTPQPAAPATVPTP